MEAGLTKLILLVIDDVTEPKNILATLGVKIKELETSLRTVAGKEHTISLLKRKVDELERRILRKQY